jgi:hypothetical protein
LRIKFRKKGGSWKHEDGSIKHEDLFPKNKINGEQGNSFRKTPSATGNYA